MTEPQTVLFRMTIDQANTVLEALGQLPYVKVHRLIAQIQAQAKQQLEPDESEQVLDAFAAMGGAGGGGAEGKVIDQAG